MKCISLHCRRAVLRLLQLDLQPGIGFTKTLFPVSTARRNFSTDTTTVRQEDVLQEEDSSDAVVEKRKVPCPENSRLMKIAIIGVPNAGKSTIINALTKFDVCPVSRRPHTTRKNQKAIYLDDNTQLVFVDTPGLVSVKEIKKFSFTPEFVLGPEKSIGTSHVIAVIHDVSNSVSRDKLDFRIKKVLEKFPDKKSVLILNKIDQIKTKSTLLDTVKYLTCGVVGGNPLPVRTFEEKRESHKLLDTEVILARAKQRFDEKGMLREASTEEDKALAVANKFFTKDEIKKGFHQLGWPHFNDIFMVSALEGDGIELLRRYLVVNAEPHHWLFDNETLTDVAPQKLALSILRSKLLEHLPQEIPFKIKPVLEFWEETEEGILSISVKLKCPKERYQYAILGTGGALINRIIKDTERALSGLLYRPIKLVLIPIFDKSLADND